MYPVSSRNDQDFLNLMDIYPDAVFHPAIYRLPEIFRREGWRYEGEGEGLCYQGVVLNEMKGALADPGTVLEAEMNRLLFPDNCYCHVSGGDPEHIPDLSYEQFIASHRKYYHPSNARISLVGSVDLDAALEKIDGFLLGFDHREVNIDIPTQTPVPTVTNTVPYAVGAEEPLTERTIISCGDPADGLLVEDQLNALAARLDTDYFVDLIRELLLDDSHSVTVIRHRPIRWERRRRRRKLPVSPPRVPHGRRSSRRSWRSRRSPWLCGSRRRIVERPWPPSLCCRSLT